MNITKYDREKLEFYLHNFYSYYPSEQFTVFHFVRYLKKRLRLKKDAWIGVSGDTGTGKSLFTLTCLILFGRRPCSLIKNMCFIPKGDEIAEKFDRLNKNMLIIDEAAKEMRSVNWQSKRQQKVNVKAMTDRYKSNVVFQLMPNFNEFTKSMRIGSLMFRAVVAYRTDKYARIFIQRKSRNWRSDDPWGDKLANAIYDNTEKKQRQEITNELITEIERGIPNTVMDFIIPNLETVVPEITNEYERLKIKSRENEMKEEKTMKNEGIYKKRYNDIMEKAAKALYKNTLNIGKVKTTKMAVAEALGISYATLNNYLSIPDKIEPNFRKPKK